MNQSGSKPIILFVYKFRGGAWYYKGEYDKAIIDLNESIRLDSRDAATFDSRGIAWYKKREYDKAIADFSESIGLDPQYVSAYSNRGNARYRKRDYDSAIDDYSEVIRLTPQDALAYECRGCIRYFKGDYDSAIADLDEAMRLGRRTSMAYRCRGHAWCEKEDFDKATADYDESIRLAPKDADAYYSCAWLLACCPVERIRDGKKAVELATKACELSAWKEADCLESLAAGLAEVGDFDSASNGKRKRWNSLRSPIRTNSSRGCNYTSPASRIGVNQNESYPC